MMLFVASALAVAPRDTVTRLSHAVRAAYPTCRFRPVNKLEWRLSCGARGTTTVWLDRVIAQCALGDEPCNDYIRTLVAEIDPGQQLPEPTLAQVVPSFRPHDYAAAANARFATGPQPTTLLTTPLTADLDVVWMFDYPDRVQPITGDSFAKLGVDWPAFLAAATDNCSRLAKMESRFSPGGLDVVDLGDYGGCVWLLPPETWTSDHAPATAFAMASAKVAVLTTSADPATTALLAGATARLAERCPATDHPLPTVVFTRRDGAWVILDTAPGP